MKIKRDQGRGVYASVLIEDGAPCCFHGPKFLLEPKDGGKPSYSCTAFRNHPACRNDREFTVHMHQLRILSSNINEKDIKNTYFCHTCGVLFIKPNKIHTDHKVVGVSSKQQLKTPSYFLETLEKSSEHAQYFFSDEWLHFMLSTFRTLRIESILCVGAPRLFDFLTKVGSSVNKFLLDLDARFESFYSISEFARFNALNGYFFDPAGKAAAENFLLSCRNRTVIFCDPPFGALMEPLVASLKKLKESIGGDSDVFLMITVPYFLGKKLLQAAPQLKMLDYKVTYEKHVRFTSTGHDGNNSKRRVSVVRLFTDAPSEEIKPPIGLEDQYWFCDVCKRFSDLSNKHCKECNACTTFHGDTYRHCRACNVCRPPSYEHCKKCNKCFRSNDTQYHPCAQQKSNEGPVAKRRKFSKR